MKLGLGAQFVGEWLQLSENEALISAALGTRHVTTQIPTLVDDLLSCGRLHPTGLDMAASHSDEGVTATVRGVGPSGFNGDGSGRGLLGGGHCLISCWSWSWSVG